MRVFSRAAEVKGSLELLAFKRQGSITLLYEQLLLSDPQNNHYWEGGVFGESLHSFWTTSVQSGAQVVYLFRGFPFAVHHSPRDLALDLAGGVSLVMSTKPC